MMRMNLYEKDVLSEEGKKIGRVVNALVNTMSGQMDLVVFPHLVTKLVRDHAGKIAGPLAGHAMSTLKQFIPGAEVAEMAIDEVGGYLGGRTGGKVKQVVTIVQESYYLVPMAFVRDIAPSGEVKLGVSYDECRKWCLNARPLPEVHIAFYPQSRYEGQERPVPITLNMPTFEGMILQDGSGIECTIKDLAVLSTDEKAGETRIGLVVSDPRQGAEVDRTIEIAQTTRRGNRFYTSMKLDEMPAI